MSNLQRKVTAGHGVANLLKNKGLKYNPAQVAKITAAFLKSKGLPYQKYNGSYKGLFTADVCNSEMVQEHWSEFVDFVNANYTQTSLNQGQNEAK